MAAENRARGISVKCMGGTKHNIYTTRRPRQSTATLLMASKGQSLNIKEFGGKHYQSFDRLCPERLQPRKSNLVRNFFSIFL